MSLCLCVTQVATAELERDGFALPVTVRGGRGCSCKREGRKPSVGNGGKRRMIVRRVGGKERAETIVQLSKEAVIEGVRIWHSIFLKTLKVRRKKVILCLIECRALPGGNPFCTGLLHQFSWFGQKAREVRAGIRRVLHVCLLGILQCNSDIVCKTRTQNHFLLSLFSPQETWISLKPEVKGHYSEEHFSSDFNTASFWGCGNLFPFFQELVLHCSVENKYIHSFIFS